MAHDLLANDALRQGRSVSILLPARRAGLGLGVGPRRTQGVGPQRVQGVADKLELALRVESLEVVPLRLVKGISRPTRGG